MTVYGNDAVGRRRQESSEKIWYGRGRAGGRWGGGVVGWWGGGRRAMFTVFSSQSSSVNPNAYVGWCNLRPPEHTRLVLA